MHMDRLQRCRWLNSYRSLKFTVKAAIVRTGRGPCYSWTHGPRAYGYLPWREGRLARVRLRRRFGRLGGGRRRGTTGRSVEFLGDGPDGGADLLRRVVAGDEEPQPGGLLFDGRIQDRLHVDAALRTVPATAAGRAPNCR